MIIIIPFNKPINGCVARICKEASGESLLI